MYNGDDSDDLGSDDLPNNCSFMQKPEVGFSLGLPPGMSKTFDISNPAGKQVPKLDFWKLKQVKEQKDWYGY